MKNLELKQMEVVSGGLDCSTGLGGATGTIASGFLLAASGPIGWGVGLVFLGGALLFAAGGNCANFQ